MRNGRVRGFSPSIMTSTHAVIDAASDAVPAEGLVIGNVFENPELAERFGLEAPEEPEAEAEPDYGARLGYRRGRSDLDGYVTMPQAMLARPRRQSRAAVRRMRGDPGVFVSSSAGALFVDTDGRRVQHGDDF